VGEGLGVQLTVHGEELRQMHEKELEEKKRGGGGGDSRCMSISFVVLYKVHIHFGVLEILGGPKRPVQKLIRFNSISATVHTYLGRQSKN